MIKASELLEYKLKLESGDLRREQIKSAIDKSLTHLDLVFESVFKEIIREGNTSLFILMDKEFKSFNLSGCESSIDIHINHRDQIQVIDSISGYFFEFGYKVSVEVLQEYYSIKVSV